MPASRSLIALLIGTVVFFALWMVALKPSSKSGGSSSHGLGQYQSAINKAHQAVGTSNASNAASGNTSSAGASASKSASAPKPSTSTSKTAVTPATHTAKTTTTTATKHTAKAASKSVTMPSSSAVHHQSLAGMISTVKTAVTHHKVVALLFYNPAASDDQALERELKSVPTHKGQVVKLAVPLNQSGNFTALTQQVPVNLSPTLVVISRAGDASEDVGYTAPFVIDQQVGDALAAH